jgi:hypothetical protein
LDELRDALGALTDLLLPGTERLPAGRSVGAHSELLDCVLAADPGLIESVLEVGKQVSQHDSVTLDDLESWEKKSMNSAIFALTAAYYMSRQVQRALDYPGIGPHPISETTPEETFSDELLAPVRDRGPRFTSP